MKDIPTENRPTLTLDVAKYEAMLDAPELSAEDRKDILDTLWMLICSFVDLGYQIQPAETCGQVPQLRAETGTCARNAIECSGTLGTAFENAPASQSKGAKP